MEDGGARERELRIGQRNRDEAQMLSGLAPGTTVLRYPSNALTDGVHVTAAR